MGPLQLYESADELVRLRVEPTQSGELESKVGAAVVFTVRLAVDEAEQPFPSITDTL